MGIITRIEAQQKNKKRASIFIDDEFFCGLETIAVLSARLKVGDEVDESYIKKLQHQSDLSASFDKAIKYLSLRLRSEREIRSYLGEKGFSAGAIDETVQKLKEYKYIDEDKFLKSYIATYKNKHGALKLRMELERFGIDRELISEAIEELGTQGDEAFALAEKYKNAKRERFEKQKLFTYLYGKGFASDDIKQAIERLENGD